jgi:hypothetical protein
MVKTRIKEGAGKFSTTNASNANKQITHTQQTTKPSDQASTFHDLTAQVLTIPDVKAD